MRDIITQALESGRSCGQNAAVAAFNGASKSELKQHCIAEAAEFDQPARAMFLREYKFWLVRTASRFRDSLAVQQGAAVPGEHLVVMYDSGFRFIKREHILTVADTHIPVRDMLCLMQEISPSVFHEISA